MIYVTIGSEERRFDAGDEHWINQQINQRRNDGLAVCVQVKVNHGDLNLNFMTAGCKLGYGGSGPAKRFSEQEQRIIDLWQKFGLSDPNFSGGNLIAFLKQIRNAL